MPGNDADREARQALLDEIEQFFTASAMPRVEAPVSERPVRLAAAVLLLEMIRADHRTLHDEHRAVARALSETLGLLPDEAASVIRLAEEERKRGLPIHHFTALVDARYSREQKRLVVCCLWRVAFADAELQPHEEYFVRKVADLLHVPFEDFLLAKIEAREAFS
jgi:uncharacterized tellurite resistance protein B-like protein